MNGIPKRPPIVIPGEAEMPSATAQLLSNGTSLYTLDALDRDVVRFSFVFHAGSSWQTVPFVASATLNLLSEGSANYTAQEIAEKLDFYGSWFDVSIDRDYSVVTFCCLRRFFSETLVLASEILLRPSFPETEIRNYKEKSRERLALNRSRIDYRSRELFGRALFGPQHPYGISSPGEKYAALTRNDLISFYKSHYTARNCFAVVGGDTDAEVLDGMTFLAEGLERSAVLPVRTIPPAEPIACASEIFEGATQSSLRIGRLLFPRMNPDYIGMQVVATVLGGYFGSRLVRNLREEKGYTYGVYSTLVNFDEAGYLAIGTEVDASATNDAVEQIFAETERLRTETVSVAELDMVRSVMLGEVLRILDGPFGIIDVTIENIQNRTDNSYVERLTGEIRHITPERIRALAEKYLRREDFTVTVVGPQDYCPR